MAEARLARPVVSPLAVAVPATIIPAMAALWWLLRRYEGYFEDARVFFSLITGFFVGLVATAFETQLFPFSDPAFVAEMGLVLAFLFFVPGYALFESGAKAVVLGLRRFRGRKDTPYYGAALGLGFGAMASLLFAGRGLAIVEAFAPELETQELLLARIVVVLVPLGAVFAHGAVGVYIGKGSADGDLRKGWALGMVLLLPTLSFYWLLFAPFQGGGVARFFLAAVGSVVYGVGLMWFAQTRVLDRVVPPEVRAKLERARRREARGHPVERSQEEIRVAAREDAERTASTAGATAGAGVAAGATQAAAEASSSVTGDRMVDVGPLVDLDSEE